MGLERAGCVTIWQSEIEEYAVERVLRKNFPTAKQLGDATKIDYSSVPVPDILAGGFMCTDISVAGKMEGVTDYTRSGITWRELVRAVRELRPTYVLVENVAALLSDNGGRTFGRVLGTLAALGYNAEWEVLSACAFGAPHTRERVFIVAHSNRHRLEGPVHDADCAAEMVGVFPRSEASGSGSPLGGNRWSVEPGVGKLVDGFPERVDQLRGLGNAVVPDVAELIGKWIIAHSQLIPPR